jgi:hypothetical protein
MVVIYSPNLSSRLTYVLDEILQHRLGLDYVILTDPEIYEQHPSKSKINYSNLSLAGLQISPEKLIFETGLGSLDLPKWSMDFGFPVLFPNDGELGFDIFSMCFWHFSRLEEYPFTPTDPHGRFLCSDSAFFEHQFHEWPSVDLAVRYLCNKLNIPPPSKFDVFPTLDIDIAFKHKGRSAAVWLGGLVRYVLGFRLKEFMERCRVLLGAKDPFDTFDYFMDRLDMHKNNVRIFILCGLHGRYDKNIDLRHKGYSSIVKRMAKKFEIGLHPSYQSQDRVGVILKEKETLEATIQKPVIRSRQHYLRMKLPDTYEALLKSGVTHDYTMGFPDRIGYRAGTAMSFRYYDIAKERGTSLVLHPFSAMDVTLKNYMGLSPSEAIEKIRSIKSNCMEWEIPFTFIFHNESLSEQDGWEGWRNVFETCLK